MRTSRTAIALMLGVLLSTSPGFAAAQGPFAQQPKQDKEHAGQTEQPKIPDQDLRDRQRVLTGVDLINDEFPGSWPMFGENVRMKIGGYAKADFVYDIDGTNDPHQFLMSTIPVEGTPEHGNSGYVSFFARETRFNIDVRRIEPGSPPLRTFIEGDFWNDDNQLRLRHAYVVAGDFLIGQTWTTLSVLESLPTLIDFAAGDALFGGRTTQFRYQTRLDEQWRIAAAIESLDFPGIENPSSLPGKSSQALPLFALRTDYRWSKGLLVLGSSVAQLRWDGGGIGPDATALQWDVLVAGRQYLGEEDFFTWNLSWGDGAGENIMAFTGSNANAVLSPSGKLDTMQSIAVNLGFRHRWSKELESNLSYAYGWLDTPPTRAPKALAEGGIGHINIIWRPAKHLSYGLEFMHGAQRTSDTSRGDASRLQLMARFDF